MEVMTAFNCIGLVARIANEQVLESLKSVEQFLLSQSVDVVFEQATAAMVGDNDRSVVELESFGSKCDLVIAVGGDGNILNA